MTKSIVAYSCCTLSGGPQCQDKKSRPEGELHFKPNASGTFDVGASVERFPNLEGYHWKNGELQGDSLFQVQNFSQEELSSDLTFFNTGVNMYDWRGRDTFIIRNDDE